MKKLILAVCAALSLACTSANLLQRGPQKPDQTVVESFVRMEDVAGARDYLVRFGIPEFEVIARIQQARERALAHPGK